jgi:hypothetical protein
MLPGTGRQGALPQLRATFGSQILPFRPVSFAGRDPPRTRRFWPVVHVLRGGPALTGASIPGRLDNLFDLKVVGSSNWRMGSSPTSLESWLGDGSITRGLPKKSRTWGLAEGILIGWLRGRDRTWWLSRLDAHAGQ